MLPFLDHLDMAQCKGMGTANDSIYQHDTIISDESLIEAVGTQCARQEVLSVARSLAESKILFISNSLNSRHQIQKTTALSEVQ